MKISMNTRYKFLQAAYEPVICASAGFATLYLQRIGLSAAGIGMFTAIFGIMAAIIQPLIGRQADINPKLTWKRMSLIFAVPFLVICIAMPFVNNMYAGALCMCFLILLENLLLPFVNGAYIYYNKNKIYVDYGTARGIGSGIYAISAVVLGIAAEKRGINTIPAFGALFITLFIITTLRMPCADEQKLEPVSDNSKKKGFLKKFPGFALMLVSTLLMLTSHTIVNTYLLQIIQSVGGDSSQLGIGIAIQAVVEVPVLCCFAILIKHVSSENMMVFASVGYVIKGLFYVISKNIGMIYFTQTLQVISFAIFCTAYVYYSYEAVTAEYHMTAQSYMTSMMVIGTVIGSLLGGWILQLQGVKTLLVVNVIIALLGVVFSMLSKKYNAKKGDKNENSNMP